MYARIVELPIIPGKKEEAVAIFARDIQPVFEKQPGFLAFFVLMGDATPDGITLTLWATLDDAERFYASEKYKSLLDKVTELLEGGPHFRNLRVESAVMHPLPARRAA